MKKLIVKSHNHDHFWVQDGILFESYNTIRGLRFMSVMTLPFPDTERLTNEQIEWFNKIIESTPAPETTTEKLAKLWPMLTETPIRFYCLEEGSLSPTLRLSLTREKYALIEHFENQNTDFSFDTVIEDRAIYLEVFHSDESKTELDPLWDFAFEIKQFLYPLIEKEA